MSAFPGDQRSQGFEPTVDARFGSRFGDAASYCRLRDAQAFQLLGRDGTPHVFWQPFHQFPNVIYTLRDDIAVVRHNRIGLLDGHGVQDVRVRRRKSNSL